MYKISIFFLVLFVMGCTKVPSISSPRFKIGECIASTFEIKRQKNLESWEKPKEIYVSKILEIGKNNYRTNVYYSHSSYEMSEPFHIDEFMETVPCPVNRD